MSTFKFAKIKNFLFSFFTKWRHIQKKHRINFSSLNILIVSTTGLGDTLWATPSIRAIKKQYPNANLSVLTTQFGSEVLQNNPYIDDVFILSSLFVFSLFRKLKKKRFQIIFIFHTSQRYVLPLCSLLKASHIIGTKNINKGLDFLLTKALSGKNKHEIDRRLEMLETISIHSPERNLEFFLPQTVKKNSSSLKIGLHPGAKDFYKCWPASHFSDLANLLKEHFNCEIILSGTEHEKELLDAIAQKIDGKVTRLENCPLKKFANYLSSIDLFITNDTGPMHLCSALKRPLICLFSPTDPKICGPIEAPYTKILYHTKTCTPCLKRKCKRPFCLLQIGPKQVFSKCVEMLEKTIA